MISTVYYDSFSFRFHFIFIVKPINNWPEWESKNSLVKSITEVHFRDACLKMENDVHNSSWNCETKFSNRNPIGVVNILPRSFGEDVRISAELLCADVAISLIFTSSKVMHLKIRMSYESNYDIIFVCKIYKWMFLVATQHNVFYFVICVSVSYSKSSI